MRALLLTFCLALGVASAAPPATPAAQLSISGYVTTGASVSGTFGWKDNTTNGCVASNVQSGSYDIGIGTATSNKAVLGLVLRSLCSLSGTYDLRINMTTNIVAPTQTSFHHVDLIDCSGAARTYAAASATYSSGQWTWGTGSSPVFTSSCSSRKVFIYR